MSPRRSLLDAPRYGLLERLQIWRVRRRATVPQWLTNADKCGPFCDPANGIHSEVYYYTAPLQRPLPWRATKVGYKGCIPSGATVECFAEEPAPDAPPCSDARRTYAARGWFRVRPLVDEYDEIANLTFEEAQR